MPIYGIILIVVASIVGIFLLTIFIGFLINFFSMSHAALKSIAKTHQENPDPNFLYMVDYDWLLDRDLFTDFHIKSKDGLDLNALYIDNKSNTTLIFAHGYTGSPIGKTKVVHKLMDKYHFNILLIEERAHGKSKAHFCTMGRKEHLDLLTWVDYLSSLNNNMKFILYGESMGGATVLMSSEYNHPKVLSIIADSAYVSIYNQFEFTARKLPKLIRKYAGFAMFLFDLIFLRMNIIKETTLNAISKTNIPLCLIQGDKDSVVSSENLSLLNKKVKENTYHEMHVFTNADHVQSWNSDEDKFLNTLYNFIDKFLQ